MLAGHFAPAFALHRIRPTVPLWLLLLGTQAVDVVFMGNVLLGIESAELRPTELPRLLVTNGVWTHSVVMTIVYALGIVAIGALIGRVHAAVVVAASVASHWLADLLVHAPDLPLGLEQSPALGLALWRWPVLAWGLEVGLVVGLGAWWIQSLTGPIRKRAIGLIVGLCVLQTLADFVIPLPPDDVALAYSALPSFFLVAAAGAWVERGGRSVVQAR